MNPTRLLRLLNAGATAFVLTIAGCGEYYEDAEVTKPEPPVTKPPPAASEDDVVGQPPPEEQDDDMPLYNPIEPVE